MRLFVVGMPCAGKSTVARVLRARCLHAVDMDDEIARLNGGTWPSTIAHKEEVLQSQVLDAAVASEQILLFNSYMQVPRAVRLRAAGFRTVLLDVQEEELRRRAAHRLALQGPTNLEWFDWHRQNLQALAAAGLIDEVVSGEQAPEAVADALTHLAREGWMPRGSEQERPCSR